MLRDRRVLACVLVAVAISVVDTWWSSGAHAASGNFGDDVYWLARLSWIAPYAVALIAVVITARAGAGMLVALAALVSGLVTVLIPVRTGNGLGVSVVGLMAYLLNVVALGPADLIAAVRQRFDLRSGAVAGLACGLALAVVVFLWSLPRFTNVPAWYVLGGYVFPPVAMALVGACTGILAAAQPPPASARRR